MSDENEVRNEIKAWWESLQENYKGERNRVRRCENLEEIKTQPAYVMLKNRLRKIENANFNDNQIALVAGLFCHVRGLIEGDSFAARAFNQDVSRGRFDPVLRLDDRKDLFRPLIRIIRQLGNTASLELAEDLLYWGNNKKQEWAEEYYSRWSRKN